MTTKVSVTKSEGRDARQKSLIPPDKLAECHAVVVGVGAVGRQVAIQLASMGLPSLSLIDFDDVEEANMGPQGYSPKEIGEPKVNAVHGTVAWLNPDCEVRIYNERFKRSEMTDYLSSNKKTQLVFCCVDSMESRMLVWETAKAANVDFFADARMAGEVLNTLVIPTPAKDVYYETTLFPDNDPGIHAGSCTTKSTIYTASIAAGLLMVGFALWLRGGVPARDTNFNLVTMEIG